METVDRIEGKAKKIVKWCHALAVVSKENHEQYLFQESSGLVFDHIWPLADIVDDIRINYAHGVDITEKIKKLKRDFNFIANFYQDLWHLYKDTYRPRRVRQRRPLGPHQ